MYTNKIKFTVKGNEIFNINIKNTNAIIICISIIKL